MHACMRGSSKELWYLRPRKENKGKTVLEYISCLLTLCKHFSAADSIDVSLPNMIEQPVKAEEGTPSKVCCVCVCVCVCVSVCV